MLIVEYVETLVKLKAAECVICLYFAFNTDKYFSEKFQLVSTKWMNTDLSELQGSSAYQADTSQTHQNERRWVQALDKLLTLQKAINDLKAKLGIEERWTPESNAWKEATTMLHTHKYWRAINHLEGLVVARLFELTKAHQSMTGVLQ